MPFTRSEDMEKSPIEQLFWGKLDLQEVGALWQFSKGGKVQNILHRIKYKSDKALAHFVGEQMAKALLNSTRFKDIDFIIPVPLHPKKLRKRGFNQSELIANGIAELLEIPVRTDLIKRVTKTSTQTKKSRIQRWHNVKDVFEVCKAEELENKRILLIDDVITTGATLEGCVLRIQDACNARISLYAAAVA